MGNPFVHIELTTRDLAKAKQFYANLFDWRLQEVPSLDYTLVQVGEGTGGGMMKSPVPNAPSQWVAYVQVSDVTASTKKVQSLGGKVLRDKTEVPGVGWFSIIADPTGAVLGLWQDMGH